MEEAKRFDNNKNRLDLLPAYSLNEIAKVFTFGAAKYGANNYRNGMSWSRCIASLERHLNAFKQGIDIDDESFLQHLAHIGANTMFLLEYTKTHPELDDRDLWWKKPLKRVYVDIDGVYAAFEEHFLSYLGLPEFHPIDWNDWRFKQNLFKIENDENFWLSMPALIKPEDISYPISGYCTARVCDDSITKKWLEINNFPDVEIINVGYNGNKYEALKDKCDVFVDDSITNFVNLNSQGIVCYLMSRPHNMKYNVGNMRVGNFNEFIEKLKV